MTPFEKRKLDSNQAGFSLMEVIVTVGLSSIMITLLANVIIDQQNSLVYARQKMKAVGLESNLERILADVRVCSCMFNPTNTAMVSGGGAFTVNKGGLGKAGSSAVSNQKISLAKLPMIPFKAGACDYGLSKSVVEVNQFYGNANENLKVKDLYIDNLHKVGEDSLDQIKGTLNVQFEYIDSSGKQYTKHPLQPAQADVVFFVDGGGVAQSCDPSAKMDEFFDEILTGFQKDQKDKFDLVDSTFVTQQTQVIGATETQITQTVTTNSTLMINEVSQAKATADSTSKADLATQLQDAKAKLGAISF